MASYSGIFLNAVFHPVASSCVNVHASIRSCAAGFLGNTSIKTRGNNYIGDMGEKKWEGRGGSDTDV